MLTPDQRSDFEQLGCVRLPEAIDRSVASELSRYAWDLLGSHGIHRDEPETWRRPRPKGIQSLARSSELNAIGSGKVRGAIDELLGPGGWRDPEHWGQLLVSLPTEGEWRPRIVVTQRLVAVQQGAVTGGPRRGPFEVR